MITADQIEAQRRYGVEWYFTEAKKRLDAARDKLALAQTEVVVAERRYNEASRAYAAERFPQRDDK